MELSFREWMMVVGVLLIVAVFLDGYRRVRNERRNRIRVSLSKQVFQHRFDDDDADNEEPDPSQPNPELPNGGARVRGKRDVLNLRESVPLLMESVRVPPAVPQPPPAADPVDPPAAETAVEEEEVPEPAPPGANAADVDVNQRPQEVLVVNVLSKDQEGFNGPDLLQILLACDLRFGRMSIFHRYEKANGRGQVQFSVANLVEPGTFSLDAIDGFHTPGVTFFLALPGPEEPIRAFDYMVETAQVLVKNLHAELRDEAHSVMTPQTLEHCRQRIRDFERRQLTLQV